MCIYKYLLFTWTQRACTEFCREHHAGGHSRNGTGFRMRTCFRDVMWVLTGSRKCSSDLNVC